MDFKELVTAYDLRGPEGDFKVASISFSEEGSVISYCVGYKYKGGNPKSSLNYTYDHTNVRLSEWDPQVAINKNLIEEILTVYGMNTETLLDLYCSLIIIP